MKCATRFLSISFLTTLAIFSNFSIAAAQEAPVPNKFLPAPTFQVPVAPVIPKAPPLAKLQAPVTPIYPVPFQEKADPKDLAIPVMEDYAIASLGIETRGQCFNFFKVAPLLDARTSCISCARYWVWGETVADFAENDLLAIRACDWAGFFETLHQLEK